jgi:hypothetical protein
LFAGLLGLGVSSGNVVDSAKHAAGNAVFSLVENAGACPFWRETGAGSAGRGSSEGSGMACG